jgi:hypothetical protein
MSASGYGQQVGIRMIEKQSLYIRWKDSQVSYNQRPALRDVKSSAGLRHLLDDLSLAKIPITSKHWTSLVAFATVGLMLHALLPSFQHSLPSSSFVAIWLWRISPSGSNWPSIGAASQPLNSARVIVFSGLGFPDSETNGAQSW